MSLLSYTCEKTFPLFNPLKSMAYLTPVIFLILPKFVAEESLTDSGCDIGCEGGIISIAVRLGILLIASICIFWKKNRAKLPQINLYRATVNGLTFGITAVYWIFFAYKVWFSNSNVFENVYLQKDHRLFIGMITPMRLLFHILRIMWIFFSSFIILLAVWCTSNQNNKYICSRWENLVLTKH